MLELFARRARRSQLQYIRGDRSRVLSQAGRELGGSNASSSWSGPVLLTFICIHELANCDFRPAERRRVGNGTK